MSWTEKRKTDHSNWYRSHLKISYEWSAIVIEYSTFAYYLDIDCDADNYLVIGEIYCFASEEITMYHSFSKMRVLVIINNTPK